MELPSQNPVVGRTGDYSSQAFYKFVSMARQAGCPAIQLRHFRKAHYVPLPKQLLFHAAARAADKKGGPIDIGLGGARGPGKSHGVLAQTGADDAQRMGGIKILLLRKVGKAAREGFEDLLQRAFPQWVPFYVPSRNILKFPNGSRIIIGHYNTEKDIDNYLGLEYDVVVIEEATTLSPTKLGIIRTCCRTSVPGWRPRVYYTFNPGGIGHTYISKLLYRPYKNGQETETRFIPCTIRDNPFINDDYRKMLESLKGWRRRAWLLGDMEVISGQYYSVWDYDVHVIDDLTELPRNWRFWLGFDYGWTHPTAVTLLASDDEDRVFVIDQHVRNKWLPKQHAEAIKAMLWKYGLAPDDLETIAAGHDAFIQRPGRSEVRTIADMYDEEGLTLRKAVIDREAGAKALLEGLGNPEEGVEPQLFICRRNHRLLDLMPSIQHDPNRPEDVMQINADEEGENGDDPFVSLRYGFMHRENRMLSGAA